MTEIFLNDRIQTGIRNLDEILHGGLPKGSLVVLAGTPGAGKTILSQQIIFHNASEKRRALIFQTLSEPTAKTLKYLKQFSFFNPQYLEDEFIQFVDLGSIMRSKGLEQGVTILMEHVKRVNPAFIIVDSFKVFEDLAHSREELRKFSYEVAINFMVWETTTFLIGEFSQSDIETNPLFSIIDGLIKLTSRVESGEQQRLIEVMKMRGTNHSRDHHPFSITSEGIGVYAPRVSIRRDPKADLHLKNMKPFRAQMGIPGLDLLLGEGIPLGSSLLVSGAAGTGKTLLSLEFIYRGAKEFGEKGLFVSFEETKERLLAEALNLGFDLEVEIQQGNIEIIFIPQTDILVEKDLLMVHEHIMQSGAKRIVLDSVSLFVHKIKDEQIAREKIFQLATLVQMAHGIGLFISDIPYGSVRLSRFGVEETVVDGVIILSSIEEGLKRNRYLEVYKMRNTRHISGKHKMHIRSGGLLIESPKKAISSSKKKSSFKKKTTKRK